MASFFTLAVDIILYVFRFLDIQDRIAFALACQQFKRLCIREGVFRKLDLSRCIISTKQRGEIRAFFRDRQLTQHIRELSISNLRTLNWQRDDQLEEFVISICPHLEALHILNCGMGLQKLHRILKQAPKLRVLSWSLLDFTSEDVQFLSFKSTISSEGIRLKNIKHLHLEILLSKLHIQITNYLLLSCFRDLEELEIYTWLINKEYFTGWNFPLEADRKILGFPQPSIENELQHLLSLKVVTVRGPLSANYDDTYKQELSDFVFSVLRRKSSSTKWKKLWILPTIGVSKRHLTDFSLLLHKNDFQSVEAIAANPGRSTNAVNELKTFFERIGDNIVKSLHLCLQNDLIFEFCELISRVGGRSLKFLRLSLDVHLLDDIPAEQNVHTHTLFSNCSNITELDLLDWYFEKDICESLSKLKHLTKVQLMQCAISSKHYDEKEDETSRANLLTLVESCKNIAHLDIRGCGIHGSFSCSLTDDDLLALAKLKNIKSLTLYNNRGITDWTFLQNISEHCKFLTMLRISAMEHFNKSHIPILMESVKFLKHLALYVPHLYLGSEVFWNLLSHANNLQRLCIRSHYRESINVPVAVESLKALPRLHVLHLHSRNIENVEDFYDQTIRMLEEKESDCRLSFEIVLENRMNTWINYQTGYTLISDKALPLTKAELCDMIPVLDIPRF